MTKKNQMYKCDICGIITEVMHSGAWELSCCGKAMNLVTENTEEAATEKHIPIIKEINEWVEILVGSIDHPMIDTHYIEWIEVITNKSISRKELYPWDKPRVKFAIPKEDIISVRAYCNIHWLWKNN